jgi:(R,R)-butanediol dehydrogenase/meso-butanediol dehydrogenase/diacetyl reductase
MGYYREIFRENPNLGKIFRRRQLKALVLKGERKLFLENIPTPIVKDGEVLIDVEIAGIGGSEYLGYNKPGIRPLPHIMGHSIVGTTDNGMRVTVYPLQGCGVCVRCKNELVQLCDSWTLIGVHSDGGFAQKVVVPKESIVELSHELTWEQSAFIEPFANSINAWEISEAKSHNTIAIVGAGSLGLGLVACANNQGCNVIEICDLSKSRLSASLELGATKGVKRLDGEFDVVFDTVGSNDTRNLTIQLAKKGGKCVFLGFKTPMHEVNFAELIRHQKRLIGSFVYSINQFERAMKLAMCSKSSWVNNLSLSEIETQLRRFLNNDFSVVKAALRPNK